MLEQIESTIVAFVLGAVLKRFIGRRIRMQEVEVMAEIFSTIVSLAVGGLAGYAALTFIFRQFLKVFNGLLY